MLGGFVLAAAVTIVLVMPPSIDPAAAQFTQTSAGPLTAADRDLLVKVRQAGLWEMPAGDMAQTRAESQRVKEVGRLIMEDHKKLDALTVQAAKKLGVVIPDEPNADQQRWLAQLAAESGPAFDKDYANLLRAAHGKVFTVVAGVRSGTRNTEIRKFAAEGINFVMRHMALLESTGLVDFQQLPEPPTPSPAPPVALAVDTRRH
ncbi:Predicted outer membrane protein [Nonomuraea wenchangensis]|uniref:Predicted outer membrane protein n=2 Tax=Nonomuraea wenchangensis TaxID=568860 RepID=A0A1I0FCR5_9ACTN|nr:Predicted outer membrane protein [Nonomuraea wenchangensis]